MKSSVCVLISLAGLFLNGAMAGAQAPVDTWESPDLEGDQAGLFRPGLIFGGDVLYSATTDSVGAPIVVGVSSSTGLIETEFKRTQPGVDTTVTFGVSLAADSQYLLAGAPFETEAGLLSAGAAYLFDAETGQELLRLTSPAPSVAGNFGHSVSLEGDLLVVGSPSLDPGGSAAAVYVFDATSGALLNTIDEVKPLEWFGASVALEGDYLAIGAPRSVRVVFGVEVPVGRVYLYQSSTGQFVREMMHPQSVVLFGTTLALNNGVLAAATATWRDGGPAPAIGFDVTTGNLLASFVPSSSPSSGGSLSTEVALSQSGDRVALGITSNYSGYGRAHVYDANTGTETAILSVNQNRVSLFGAAVALSEGGLLGALAPGSATPSGIAPTVHMLEVSSGQEQFSLGGGDLAFGDDFGSQFEVDGARALVGASADDDFGSNSGTAYLIEESSGATLFEMHSPNAAEGDRFGLSLALSGPYAVVSAVYDDVAGEDAGAVYVFDANTGALMHELFASDPMPGGRFGSSLSINEDRLVVGAPMPGLAGGTAGTGAAYLFDLTTGLELQRLVALDADLEDRFGEAVAIAEGQLYVGAPGTDEVKPNSGSVYAFNLVGDQLFQLQAEVPFSFVGLGTFLSIENRNLVVGVQPNLDVRFYVFDVITQEQVAAQGGGGFPVIVGFEPEVFSGRIITGENDFLSEGSAKVFNLVTGELVDEFENPSASLGLQFGLSTELGAGRAYVAAPLQGLIYVFESEPEPFVYCEAKPASQGCLPAIAFAGGPSAAQATSFELTANDVLNNKAGLLIYGEGQTTAIPFQGGLLCAFPPYRRTPLQFSGGSQLGSDCSGSLSFDMNVWIQSGMDPTLVPGMAFGAQFWFRDPAASFGVGLTDAVGFEVLP